MTPKLVIFDCDGVLVDSEPVTARLISENLTGYGFEISPDRVDELFTGGTMHGVGELVRSRGIDLPPTWLAEINSTIYAELRQGVDLLPGVFDVLGALTAKGVATAIASNGPMPKMEITLKPSGLWDHFDGRIYSGHNHQPKPKPDMLLHACKVASVGIEDAVMIDDSTAGCSSAMNAKMRCLGLDTHGDGAHLAAVGATPVRSFKDVAAQLGLA